MDHHSLFAPQPFRNQDRSGRFPGRWFAVLGILAVMVGLLPDLASAEPAPARLKVIATFSILGDVVSNIAGDNIDLTVLVGADGDAHTYEPSPGDAKAIAQANIVFTNGLDFESWLEKLYAASGSKALQAVTTEGVTSRKFIEDGKEETDPHQWQDVKNTLIVARNVAKVLIAKDPSHANTYQVNLETYLKALTELDNYIVEKTKSLPQERHKLVTSHDALGYFAARYGYTISGTVLASVSTEASEPSAKRMAELVKEIKQAGVPAIFTENMHNPKVAEQIALDAKVKIVTSLYTDALGPKGSDGETYVKMMRSNIDAIVGALK